MKHIVVRGTIQEDDMVLAKLYLRKDGTEEEIGQLKISKGQWNIFMRDAMRDRKDAVYEFHSDWQANDIHESVDLELHGPGAGSE